MLTRIRNALVARHDFTDVPASRLKAALADVLRKEGYITGYEMNEQGVRKVIRIGLAYGPNREPAIAGIQRVSKPGLRVFSGRREIPRVYGGLGIAIMSTPDGVMTGKEARRRGVGGEVLCYVW